MSGGATGTKSSRQKNGFRKLFTADTCEFRRLRMDFDTLRALGRESQPGLKLFGG
jgi:hypothetical protein